MSKQSTSGAALPGFGQAAGDIALSSKQAISDIKPVNPITWGIIPAVIALVIVLLLMMFAVGVPSSVWGVAAYLVVPIAAGALVGYGGYTLGFIINNPGFYAKTYAVGEAADAVGELWD